MKSADPKAPLIPTGMSAAKAIKTRPPHRGSVCACCGVKAESRRIWGCLWCPEHEYVPHSFTRQLRDCENKDDEFKKIWGNLKELRFFEQSYVKGEKKKPSGSDYLDRAKRTRELREVQEAEQKRQQLLRSSQSSTSTIEDDTCPF